MCTYLLSGRVPALDPCFKLLLFSLIGVPVGVSPFDAAKGGGKMAAIQFLMRKGAGGRGGRRRGR